MYNVFSLKRISDCQNSSAELIFGQQEAEGMGWELLEAMMLGCYLLEVILRKLKMKLSSAAFSAFP